jgi:hypothetical protein
VSLVHRLVFALWFAWGKVCRRAPFAIAVALALLLPAAGCNPWRPAAAPCAPPLPGVVATATGPSNAIVVPAMDREVLWKQLVDMTDDYFRIDREHRVQQVGEVLTEGRIETQPQIGATVFEPLRKDAANCYERSLDTLQTIRRRASIRVTPSGAGSLVEVSVVKEQENLRQPMRSTAGAATFRHDNSIERELGNQPGGLMRLDWYPIGRDIALEQTMLDDLQDRLGLPPSRATLPSVVGADAAAEYYRPQETNAPGPIEAAPSAADATTLERLPLPNEIPPGETLPAPSGPPR